MILTGKRWLSIGQEHAYVHFLKHLNRVNHVWKIRDRKQRMEIGKYSFVSRTIKNWNQLPAEALRTFPCKLRKRVRKAIINGVKRKE
jgi:hypothetical protein